MMQNQILKMRMMTCITSPMTMTMMMRIMIRMKEMKTMNVNSFVKVFTRLFSDCYSASVCIVIHFPIMYFEHMNI